MFIPVPQGYHKLVDTSSSGRVQPWQDKKINTHFYAESYTRIGYDKRAQQLYDCGTFLEFKKYLDNSMKLNHANFCKVRMCPMCAWRRSLKIFGQVSQIMNKLVENNQYQFLFLTLTVKNCNSDDLSYLLDKMSDAFNKLTHRKLFKDNIKGYFRALEVTHNVNKHSISFDTYHPHFHVILVVNRSYFHKDYIKQDEWVDMWQSCLKIDYKPIVDIRKIDDSDNNISHVVAETAKYTVKDTDVLNADEDLMDRTLKTFDNSLAYRRLIGLGGVFKEISQELQLDDMTDGDLVNTDNDTLNSELEYVIVRYKWNVGFFNYAEYDIDTFEYLKENNNEI